MVRFRKRFILKISNQISQKTAEISLVGLSVSGFILSIVLFFPGWMSPDSVDQYRQAHQGWFYDWHPPLMAMWWGLLDKIISGQVLMLIQNLLFFWVAVYLVSSTLMIKAQMRAFFLFFAMSLPSSTLLLGMIWKDVQFATTVFLIFAIMYWYRNRKKALDFAIAVVLVVLGIYAIGVKPNGIIFFPVLAYFALSLLGRLKNKLFSIAAFSIIIPLSLGAFSFGLTELVQPVKTFPFQYTQTYDLLAISVKTGENVFPPYIKEALGSTDLTSVYMVGSNNPLMFGVEGVFTTDQNKLRELQETWLREISRQPFEYLEHRMENFYSLLRVGSVGTAYVLSPGISENELGLKSELTEFSRVAGNIPTYFPILFFPWLAFLVSSFFILFVRLSGISAGMPFYSSWLIATLFALPHFFIGPASDYRYLLTSVMFWIMSVFLVEGKKTQDNHVRLSAKA